METSVFRFCGDFKKNAYKFMQKRIPTAEAIYKQKQNKLIYNFA